MTSKPKDNGGKPAKAKKTSQANRPAKTENKLMKLFFGKKKGK